MKFAHRAKLFRFASLSLIMLLFLPSTLPTVSSAQGKPGQRQVAPAKLQHSFIYRRNSPLRDLVALPTASPSPVSVRANIQMVSWQGYADPVLKNFLRNITNGDSHMIKGIYAPGKFALEVIQQPKGEWTFVSQDQGVVTQFQSASDPVTGLLAHNYLEGKHFYDLSVGEELDVLYGNGFTRRYQVSSIYKYQKLNTNSLSSDLIDLNSGKRVTTGDVFQKLYTGDERITLQTCLEGEGISNWGLYFVIAQPVMNIQ